MTIERSPNGKDGKPMSIDSDAVESSDPQLSHGRRRPGRERLLATADRLLYRDGLVSSGIDRIIDQAGIAKGTLYGNFGSKDDLIDAYLRERHQRTIDVFRRIEASGGSPLEQADAVFDYLADQTRDEDFRGCAFVIAAVEVPAEDRPPMRWARTNKRAVRECLERMFRAGGLAEPDILADQVCILYDGALMTSVMRPESNAVETARQMAKVLIQTRFSA